LLQRKEKNSQSVLVSLTGPLIVVALCLLSLIPSDDFLRYQNRLVWQGEIWRLVTASFTHVSLSHLLLNLAGVSTLWLLHGDYYSTWRFLFIVLISACGTTIGLLLFFESVTWYVGLSGALHGVFVWGVVRDFEKGRKTAWLLSLGLVIKLGYEMIWGADPSIETLIGSKVVVAAHLCGTISGFLLVAPRFILQRLKAPKHLGAGT